MFLYRLAHPFTLKGTAQQFWGYHRTYLNKYTNAVQTWFVERWRHLLTLDVDRATQNINTWATKVGNKMEMPDPTRCRCWAFIDGVFRHCCRPGQDQDVLYNTYYKGHGFKYQSIVTPDGLISDCWGPLPGRHHDIYLWYTSGCGHLCDELPHHHPSGNPYFIFGDKAYKSYTCADHIVTAYRRPPQGLPPHQAAFNYYHNRVRVSVEWCFRIVTQQWGAINFRDLEKSGLSSLGYRFLAAVLLTNMRTCLNGMNQISTYFDCPPPSLLEYLSKPYEQDPRVHSTMDIWGAREEEDD
jgi:hypothetical protein